MPYLSLTTNLAIEDETTLLIDLSSLAAEQLGKSATYVMVVVNAEQSMIFGGTDAPTAHMSLKSLGLQPEQAVDLSAAICTYLQDALGIPPDRVYIEFHDPPRNMWGWNSKTFS